MRLKGSGDIAKPRIIRDVGESVGTVACLDDFYNDPLQLRGVRKVVVETPSLSTPATPAPPAPAGAANRNIEQFCRSQLMLA